MASFSGSPERSAGSSSVPTNAMAGSSSQWWGQDTLSVRRYWSSASRTTPASEVPRRWATFVIARCCSLVRYSCVRFSEIGILYIMLYNGPKSSAAPFLPGLSVAQGEHAVDGDTGAFAELGGHFDAG